MMPRKDVIMRLLNKIIGRKRMVEDNAKVALYLRGLNGGSTGPWVAADGFSIWPGFEFGKNGQNNTIKAGEGIVVKVFFNTQNGDVKTVLAQAMIKNG